MPSIAPATIEYKNDDVTVIANGGIDWNGVSPTAKVRVGEWDHGKRRLEHVDKITGATVTETDEGATITGLSETAGKPVKITVIRARKCC